MLLDISSWWAAMGGLEHVYWLITIPATLFLTIFLILAFLGGDVEGDMGEVDADVETDTGIGFQFLSVKSAAGFFAMFGWSGLACIDAGFGTFATILISTLCGLAMMALIAGIFWFMLKMTSSGTLNLNNSIGKLGEVYLVIPAKRGGMGKIQINVQGGLRELSALTDDGDELSHGSIVKVLKVIDQHILLVTKSRS
jgi:hypothetical protein